jgi:transcriptional regulator with XRE-family HTH domain
MPSIPAVDIARVKQLLSQGLSQKQVVQRLGYSKCTVSRIANGKYTQEAR